MISGALYHLVATYSVKKPVWSWLGSATRASPKSQICKCTHTAFTVNKIIILKHQTTFNSLHNGFMLLHTNINTKTEECAHIQLANYHISCHLTNSIGIKLFWAQKISRFNQSCNSSSSNSSNCSSRRLRQLFCNLSITYPLKLSSASSNEYMTHKAYVNRR